MIVYVLTEIDIDTKVERPVAVVTEESVADEFYQKDTKNRDYIPFQLNEVPMLSGVVPTPPQQPKPDANAEANRQTRQNLQEANKLMQEIMQRVQKNKRK